MALDDYGPRGRVDDANPCGVSDPVLGVVCKPFGRAVVVRSFLQALRFKVRRLGMNRYGQSQVKRVKKKKTEKRVRACPSRSIGENAKNNGKRVVRIEAKRERMDKWNH